jgi:hypothetical protein
MLLTLRPERPLSTVVDCIWHHEGVQAVDGRDHVLPDGRFQIVLNLAAGKGAVCGLRSKHIVIDTAQIPSKRKSLITKNVPMPALPMWFSRL